MAWQSDADLSLLTWLSSVSFVRKGGEGGGHEMAQLVEALRYKPGGRGFDSRWFHWNFSLIQSLQPRYGPGVDSASNSNEYQEYFLVGKCGRCIGLTTLPPSCADCLAIWEPQLPGTLRACPGQQWDYFIFTFTNQFCFLPLFPICNFAFINICVLVSS